jgi:hypothetical protein
MPARLAHVRPAGERCRLALLDQQQLPAQKFALEVEQRQLLLQKFMDVRAFRAPRLRPIHPGAHDHHRQATLILKQFPDPLVQGPLPGGLHPPGRAVRQPQSGGAQVLPQPSPRYGGLAYVANSAQVPRIRQGVDCHAVCRDAGVVAAVRGQAGAQVTRQRLPAPRRRLRLLSVRARMI